jgi:Bacterial Ig domain
MSARVCSRAGFVAASGLVTLLVVPATLRAQSVSTTFKVAYFNIQSGKGEPAMTGHVTEFYDVSNCADRTQPLNAWGIGMVQRHLVESVGKDARIIALGLGEAWLCGSPENVRAALGWKSRSTERNGVGMVARYGFGGPEEWIQLDTSLNTNPGDTKWVLRVPVCMTADCTQTINVFSAHWGGNSTTLDRQGQQTIAFLRRTGGTAPHVLVGDFNAWEGVPTCGQTPTASGLSHLRDAGYIDAWPHVNGSAEGFTGMTNRSGCGSPVGYAWKRIDYAWTPGDFHPLSMTRFGIVPAGDGAPSDHYGIVAEYPWPGRVDDGDRVAPVVTLVNPADGQTVSGTMTISANASDDRGVARVEIFEDGVLAHTLTSAPYQVPCDTTRKSDGAHKIQARAYDAAGNFSSSGIVTTYVDNVMDGGSGGTPSTTEIVLYAKTASAIAGAWRVVADASAAGGARMATADAGAPKLATALAAPANYFEMTFNADAGRAYRLWIRGRAERDYWGNDSVFVQFDRAVDVRGTPIFRIGTTQATWASVEECSGCALAGWGWQDNGYGAGVFGPLVYFAASGPQTIRVQTREDGISIDQIVLSSQQYLTTAPGAPRLDATIVPAAYVPPPIVVRKEIVLGASAVKTIAGGWKLLADSTAANGAAVGYPDAGGAKLSSALAAPSHYVEFTFEADAGRSYRLWLRGRADANYWGNDSVFVQFSGAVDASGNPVYRIGTTDATWVNLEEASGAGLAGWGWQDNGWGTGVLGPVLRFAATGPQTIRIQTREDGLRIDQLVLSAEKYLIAAPGAMKNDATIVR